MTERKRIGLRIVELREAKGLSQKELADLIDIWPNNLSRIENGKFDVKLGTLSDIGKPLGMKIDFIPE